MKWQLDKKAIIVGVTGSIAAYKACAVVRDLIRAGAEVRVVMTKAAQKFVAPLTFETLTGHEVVTELFPAHKVVKTRHIHWAEWADCILVSPATANMVAKVATGIADDFLSTLITATRCPVLFAPAMDYQMAVNSIYLENCEKLKNLGYGFIDPEEGELASGAIGPGRLASNDRIFHAVASQVLKSNQMQGKRVLVTAGPTQEPIDPVRYISNASSGKMGFALAEAAFLRGADVTLIHGPSDLNTFAGIQATSIRTAEQMAQEVRKHWPDHDLLIMAAAVSDFTPVQSSKQKIKKSDADITLQLKRTEDIIQSAATEKGNRVVVGFALETEDGERHAREKLQAKKLDLICLNDATEAGAGFYTDTNRVTLIDKAGNIKQLDLMSKQDTASHILDAIENLKKGQSVHAES
ncbi:bifunctional phosphopantothenoylcysteine decarboxylase/phosphopantothenate--cysteine ligase CoaBC [candidate division KSB1 bacterium]|nr:bifunctional phosphopantothenoylcysteine decarboxylase/phosphopantothenate--cysteine ligase CoaBC [candidate division KSB1 bacterium]